MENDPRDTTENLNGFCAKYSCIIFLLMLFTPAIAQETSIYTQNFTGIKSAKFYYTEKDSTGKVTMKSRLLEECFFDASGRITRILHHSEGYGVFTLLEAKYEYY